LPEPREGEFLHIVQFDVVVQRSAFCILRSAFYVLSSKF
jgi:hypothetical protein